MQDAPVETAKKHTLKLVVSYVKKVWRLAIRLIALALSVLSLAGIPADYEKWQEWIDATLHDPRGEMLARQAVEFANFANQFWVRGLFIVIAITIFIWAWRPFWRIRHKLKFNWRRLLTNKVWIPRETAIEVIRSSDWAKIKEPHTKRTSSILDGLNIHLMGLTAVTSTGLSEQKKLEFKFNIYLDRTLDAFIAVNPESFRVKDGHNQVEEVALIKFLSKAMDEEIAKDFGETPSFKV